MVVVGVIVVAEVMVGGVMVVAEYMELLEVCSMPLEDMLVEPLEAMGVVMAPTVGASHMADFMEVL